MVRDRCIERRNDFIVERRQARSHPGKLEHLSLADRSIGIDDRMQALALGKPRVDDGRKSPQFHWKTDVPMADEDTRDELPGGSRNYGLADGLLELTFTAQRKA